MKVEEISTHGDFDTLELAMARAQDLNGVNGNDNLEYTIKIENGKYVVVLLAGLSDDSI